jgi:homoserine O-acetyltransferase
VWRARFETTQGDFVVEVERDRAPLGVDRFYNLVRLGYYDDTRFHRVREGYIVQFGLHGDPAVNRAWLHQQLQDDPARGSNVRGTFAFARSPEPRTRNTQIYINLGDNTRNDAEPFALFGWVVEGMDVLDRLYSGYGEESGSGVRQGRQGPIIEGGNSYLDREFPLLDRLIRARILEEPAPDPCMGSEVRTIGALEAELNRLAARSPTTPDERCELAAVLEKAGRLEEAEEVLDEILDSQPRRVGANLLLARVYQRTDRGREAEDLLESGAMAAPGDLHVRIALAAAGADKGTAEAFGPILEDHPESVDALASAAAALIRLEETDSARVLLDRALALDSVDPRLHVLDAELLEEDDEDESARAAVHRALELDSLSIDGRLALAQMLRSDGDLQGAFEESLLVLRLDPLNAEVHRNLGNGGSVVSWGKYPPLDDDEVPDQMADLLDQGDQHLLSREYDRAEAVYREALGAHPGYAAALLGLCAVYYYRGEYERSLHQCLAVSEEHPSLGLAHYGVSQSRGRIRDEGDPELEEAVERFRLRPRPPEPEGLREVFPDFDRVDEDLQKVILLSVAPLSNYVKVLAAAGATYQLIPFHKRLWELPKKERNRGRRTFDLRLWDDVKGQGGFHSTAGEEWIRDTMYERFNVLAHEFMHQVHSMFTEEQRREVEALFRLAKREERTLDSYADYNEMEYLAQAYEAFVSPAKRPALRGTAGHTLSEVEEKDPAVIRFLEAVNHRPSYRENEIVAFRQKVQTLTREGDLAAAEAEAREALQRYGANTDLLSALSGVLRLKGEFSRAMEVDRRSIEEFPEEIRGYQDLSEDLALASHDHGAAADVMAEYLELYPGSDEAWLDLAGYAADGGRYQDADRALAKADSIIGSPNPEARYHSLTAQLALVRGDTATAVEAYEYTLRNISRGNIPAWTALAIHWVGEGDLREAALRLEAARAIDADHPRVREVGALLLEAQGDMEGAVDTLTALYEDDPTRIETLTELVRILGENAPEKARSFAEAGSALFEAMAPVEFRFERDRWVAHGRLTDPSVRRFQQEWRRWRERGGG